MTSVRYLFHKDSFNKCCLISQDMERIKRQLDGIANDNNDNKKQKVEHECKIIFIHVYI